MAADHWSIEYHLIAEGWVSGTSKTFGKVDGAEVPRPSATVETGKRIAIKARRSLRMSTPTDCYGMTRVGRRQHVAPRGANTQTRSPMRRRTSEPPTARRREWTLAEAQVRQETLRVSGWGAA